MSNIKTTCKSNSISHKPQSKNGHQPVNNLLGIIPTNNWESSKNICIIQKIQIHNYFY